MTIHTVDFIGSFERYTQCPKKRKPEYAFIGRSNVGKSSLTNYLTGRKDLAHVSKHPGRTQTMNYFLVNSAWHLVDLPGYGYARISKVSRAKWRKMIEEYLLHREFLVAAYILLDINVSPQEVDLEFMRWVGEHGVPFRIVFTKCDKSKPREVEAAVELYKQTLLEEWEELPPIFLTSSAKKEGKKAILNDIQELNTQLGFPS